MHLQTELTNTLLYDDIGLAIDLSKVIFSDGSELSVPKARFIITSAHTMIFALDYSLAFAICAERFNNEKPNDDQNQIRPFRAQIILRAISDGLGSA
jgi:hypothetical protein